MNVSKISESKTDLDDLHRAVKLLESPSLTARLSNAVGSVIETGFALLPGDASKEIGSVVEAALHHAADIAFRTLENEPNRQASTVWNKVYTGLSGAVGGSLGWVTMLAEVPASTVLMVRAIADIARSEGFDLDDIETKSSCLEVLALGGNSGDDDDSDMGYYTFRGFAAASVNEMGKALAEVAAKNASKQAQIVSTTQVGELLSKVIQLVAERLGIVITQKLATMMVPVVGAVAGATVNIMFMDYYQDVARGHFIVKRLEKKYGVNDVRATYVQFAKQLTPKSRTARVPKAFTTA